MCVPFVAASVPSYIISTYRSRCSASGFSSGAGAGASEAERRRRPTAPPRSRRIRSFCSSLSSSSTLERFDGWMSWHFSMISSASRSMLEFSLSVFSLICFVFSCRSATMGSPSSPSTVASTS